MDEETPSVPDTFFDMYEELPDGWAIDKRWGSPVAGWVPIWDGMSPLRGGKKGLLRQPRPEQVPEPDTPRLRAPISATAEPKPIISPAEQREVAHTVNQLAREKFKLKLMQEIAFDLTVCKIEGWDSTQYVTELKRLIDEAHRKISAPSRRPRQSPKLKQMELWESRPPTT